MSSRKKDLPSRLLEHIKERGLIQEGDKVMVAVSGGADSMALLSCLVKIKSALKIELSIAHFNHGLRENAIRDEKFVQEKASLLGIPCITGRGDVKGEACRLHGSLEDVARRLRYKFLEEIAKKEGIQWVATAHTATDQAETLLIRLIRGTGLIGLAGIREIMGGRFIRPFLCVTREDVRRYVQENQIDFIDDESNKDERFLRNWVRKRILPLLKEINPRIDYALSDLANDSMMLSDYMLGEVDSFISRDSNGDVVITANMARHCPLPILSYVIQRAYALVSDEAKPLSRNQVDAILRILLQSDAGLRTFNLPCHIRVISEKGMCRFVRNISVQVSEKQCNKPNHKRPTSEKDFG